MNKSRNKSTVTPQAYGPDALDTVDADAPVSSYASGDSAVYSLESLEVKDPNQPRVNAPNTATATVGSLRSVAFSKRRAFVVSSFITILITLLTAASIAVFSRSKSGSDTSVNSSIPTQDIDIIGAEDQLNAPELVGQEESLLVNGDIISRGFLKLSKDSFIATIAAGTLSDNRTYELPDESGTLCLDTNNCNFITDEQFNLLQQQVTLQAAGVQSVTSGSANLTVLDDGNGNVVISDTSSSAGVNAVNGASGDITLQGTPNRITVNAAGGTLTFSTPQDINTGASPIFSGLRLTGLNCAGLANGGALTTSGAGQLVCSNDDGGGGIGGGGTDGVIAMFTAGGTSIGDSIISQGLGNISIVGDLLLGNANTLFANNIAQTANGQNVSINAGSDIITFTAGGRSFQFPTTGVAMQTICTTGVTCASGGGEAVILAPIGGAQTDNTADASIFINDTGGGNLFQLQRNGSNSFVIDTNGNITTNGGTINGQTISSTANFTGTIAIAGGTATLGTTATPGVLTTVANGAGLTRNLTIATGNALGGNSGDLLIRTGTSDATRGAIRLAAGGNDNATNIFLTGIDCSGFNSNGTLTVDGAGQLICSDDEGGDGVGIGGSGTAGRIARFTPNGTTLGDSSLTDNGTDATATGDFTIQGGGLTLGAGTGSLGSIVFHDNDGAGTETVTLNTPDVTSSYTLTLPTAAGSNNQCLRTNGAGQLFFDDCSGGGSGSGVDSLEGLTGVLDLQGAANEIEISDNGSNQITIGLPDDVTIGNNLTVTSGLTLTGITSGFLEVNGSGVVSAGTINLGTDTTGDYVASFTAGGGLTGNASGEGSTPTLAVGAGNGIQVNADDIAIALHATGPGLQVDGNGLSLLRTCNNNQILKWNNGTSSWGCSDDAGGSGTGDDVYVNGVALNNADFLDTSATAASVATTWSVNAVNPDEITLSLGVASGGDAGIVTANNQTFGGEKTFNAEIQASGGIDIGSQTLTGAAAVINFSNFDVDGSGNTVLGANATLRLTGGTTANRPGVPTEGMIYFDTDTDSLLVYSNGKWQADRSSYVLVAASNSSQAAKDSADYVADGNGGGAGDGDQVQINAALTAAAAAGGKGKVYLFAGTYVVDAAISVPNNITLAGTGRNTLIELADLDASENAIENSDQSTGTGVTIQDLRLDGRDDLNTAGTQYGVYLLRMGENGGASARPGAKVTNVIANRFRDSGFFLVVSSNNILTGNTSQDNVAGFDINTNAHNNTLVGNLAQGNGTGFWIIGSDNNTLTGNTAQGNVIGFDVSGDNNALTGNTSQGSTNTGIEVSGGDGNTIGANKIHDSGGAAANNGIYLESSDSNSIVGNNITDTQCDTTCYAINISDAASDNNYLADNYFTDTDGDDDSSINDQGTGTIHGGQHDGSGDFVIQPAGEIDLNANTNINGNLVATGNGTFNGNLTVQGNTAIGNANTDTLTIYAGTSGVGITFVDPSFQGCTALETNGSGVLVCGSDEGAGPSTTLQQAYDNGPTGDVNQVVTLDSDQDSIHIFNPSTSGTTSGFLLQSENTATGVTLGNFTNTRINSTGSFNTTAGNLTNYGLYVNNSSTESAGGNTLTNVGLMVSVQNGDTNYAALFQGGNVGIGDLTPDATLDVAGSLLAGTNSEFQVASNGDVQTSGTLTLTGNTTANRPGGASAGTLYYDTDTDTLLVYNGTKWVADRGEYFIVAANDSTQAEKDSADYVADGTSDEDEINSALTAASGGKVLLLAGTYVADGTILVPNNTTLSGVGRGTLIELADIDATDNLIENSDTTTGTGVTIRDLRLDGRSDLNTAGTQRALFLLEMGGGSGASLRKGAHISNVSITRFRSEAIRLYSSSNNTIESNSITNSTGTGILVDGGLGLGSHLNVITDNSIRYLSSGAVHIEEGTRNVFQGNIFSDNSGGVTMETGLHTFTGNTVSNNSGGGFILSVSAFSNTFTGNTVSNNSGVGFSLIGVGDNIISNNNISNNGGSSANNGIVLSTSDSNSIVGNHITDTQCDTTCYAINISDAASDNNYLADNYFTDTDGDDDSSINDQGTGTIHGGQHDGSGDFVIQPAGNIELIANTNITGSLDVSGDIALGSDGVVDDVSLLYFGQTVDSVLNLQQTFTDLTSTDTVGGIVNHILLDPAANATAAIFGIDSTVRVASGNGNDIDFIVAGGFNVDHAGDGAASALIGATANVLNSGGGAVSNAWASSYQVQNTGLGTIDTAVGGMFAAHSGANIDNAVGIFLEDQTDGSLANVNLLLGSGSPTGNYSLYSGSTYDSYFEGQLGIGVDPTNGNLEVTASGTDEAIYATSVDGEAIQGVSSGNGSGITGVATGAGAGVAGGTSGTGNAGIFINSNAANASTTLGAVGTSGQVGDLFALATDLFGDEVLTVHESTGLTLGDSDFAGRLNIHDGTGQRAIIQVGNLAADTTLTIPSTLGATDTFCFVNINNCPGTGTTLQGAYNADVDSATAEITTTDADGSIVFNLHNSAGTDPSFLVNIQGTGNTFAVQDGGASFFTASDGRNVTYNGGSAGQMSLVSDLSLGARSTSLLSILQTNNGSNNNTASLLSVQNGDAGSSAPVAEFVQNSGAGIGVLINAGSITSGRALDISWANNAFTSGTAIRVNGSGSATTSFSGSYIDVSVTRTGLIGSVTDSGSFLRLNRANDQGTGTFNLTGDLAVLQSNCISCSTDTGNILELNQQNITATGATLNVLNSGIGNLAIFDGSNASANGVSIDVQSNSSSQYALQITGNNGANNLLNVTANGTLRINNTGTADVATAKLYVVGNSQFDGIIRVGDSGSDYAEFNADGQLRFTGNARNAVTATLTPEFEGAILRGTGVGYMTADMCSDALNINDGGGANACDTSEAHNYYEWTTVEASPQTYDTYVKWRVPSDFDDSSGFQDNISFSLFGWRTDATNNQIQVNLFNDAGGVCGTADQNVTGTATDWNSLSFAGMAADADCNNSAIDAGDYVTFRFRMTADTNDFVRLGEIEINYSSVF